MLQSPSPPLLVQRRAPEPPTAGARAEDASIGTMGTAEYALRNWPELAAPRR